MTNNRLECIFEIVIQLFKYFMQHPDIRFHQALVDLNLIIPGSDLYYEESSVTLERIKQ